MYIQAKHAGFTLMEMMITVAIIAIIASIALPAYNGYMQTSRASECTNEMSLIRLAEEEFFLENNTYFTGTTQAGATTLRDNSTGFYTQSVPDATANCFYAVVLPGTVGPNYTVTATGQNDLTAAGVTLTIGN